MKSKDIPRTVAEKLTPDFVKYLRDQLHKPINDLDTEKIGALPGSGENNIVVIDNEEKVKDSGKPIPSGDVVGSTDTQTLSNKTLTTPAIGNFSNANHDHSDAASGGAVDHGGLSGLGDDDHSQYHNDARGDARYPLKSDGWSGTFTNGDGKTVTVTNGIITGVV